MISCGEDKAKDINISELKTACEVVDAVLLVSNEIVALGEAVDSEKGASEAQKKQYNVLIEKGGEIENGMRKMDLDKSKLKACPNFEISDGIFKKAKKLRKVFK